VAPAINLAAMRLAETMIGLDMSFFSIFTEVVGGDGSRPGGGGRTSSNGCR
jgi:hypothetical protein